MFTLEDLISDLFLLICRYHGPLAVQ